MAAKNAPDCDVGGGISGYGKGFYVTPKMDCPHVGNIVAGDQKIGVDPNEKCSKCDERVENWLCLSCGIVYCSRYINRHMVDHNEESGHPIAISYADISIWCYLCDSYIESPLLQPISQTVAQEKFK